MPQGKGKLVCANSWTDFHSRATIRYRPKCFWLNQQQSKHGPYALPNGTWYNEIHNCKYVYPQGIMFGKYNITVIPNSRISLLCNNMCHAHVMLHNEKC